MRQTFRSSGRPAAGERGPPRDFAGGRVACDPSLGYNLPCARRTSIVGQESIGRGPAAFTRNKSSTTGSNARAVCRGSPGNRSIAKRSSKRLGASKMAQARVRSRSCRSYRAAPRVIPSAQMERHRLQDRHDSVVSRGRQEAARVESPNASGVARGVAILSRKARGRVWWASLPIGI
jgi:hypothetical protein